MEKWFVIGSLIGIFTGITIGKIMFDTDSKLPHVSKNITSNRVKDLLSDNESLREQIKFLIEENNILKSELSKKENDLK